MIYHARQYNEIIGDPLYDHNRHAYRMKIIWDIEGNPVLIMRIILERYCFGRKYICKKLFKRIISTLTAIVVICACVLPVQAKLMEWCTCL